MEFIKDTELFGLYVSKNNGKIETTNLNLVVAATEGRFKIAFKVIESGEYHVDHTPNVEDHFNKEPGYVSSCMCGDWAHGTHMYFTTPELRQAFSDSLI